jgi:stress response protein SCP2
MSEQVLSLAAGQNVAAPSGPWDVRLRVRSGFDVDLCALLVGEDGKVAGDDDFVFYNAPRHASGAVALTDDPSSTGLRIDPAAVPAGVARIVIAVTVEVEGSLTGMDVRLHGEGTGSVLAFAPAQLDGVTTAVLLEVYRRAGSWKVRAVGQGWATGLAGLATDYGIAVDDDSVDDEPTSAQDTGTQRESDGRRAIKDDQVAPADRAALVDDLTRLTAQRAALSAELFSLTKRVRDARAELAQTDELALLQEVGYYQFSHPLDDAVAYRERLEALRGRIKAAIRDKVAVRSRPGWMVNGSVKEGAALVRDFGALMLRAYNVEADNCVRTVRPHSIEASIKRLDRTRDAILKLGASMGITIDDDYHGMRVRELRLTTDFLAKAAQEKEETRAERERLREEAKALAELQREEAKLLKERSHYETALARLLEGDDVEAQEQIRQQIREIDSSLAGVREREANTRAGFVYVISNPGAFGEVMVKIGMTRRYDPMDRVRELGNASVPFRFDVHALIFSKDALGLEAALHRAFDAQRVNRVNLRREFFYVSPAAVREVLIEIGRDHILEYKDTAEALEWRQSRDGASPDRAAAGSGRAGVQLRRQ